MCHINYQLTAQVLALMLSDNVLVLNFQCIVSVATL